MRHCGAIWIVVMSVAPAFAADLPSRKPGLWEVRMGVDGKTAGMAIQQCIDANTDQMMQSSAGPIAAQACSKRDVQRSGDTITIDSTCVISGKPANAHAVITGSFDSAYTMNVTSQSDAIPTGTTMTIQGKWLGPCAADQKPGDMIMPGGFKANILELQKRSGQLGAPGAPP